MKMDTNNITNNKQASLRLWPGILLVVLQWVFRYIAPIIEPEAIIIGVFGVLVFGLGIIIWWLFFSKAQLFDRLIPIPITILSLYITYQVLDKSIATANMNFMFTMYSIPVMCLAFVAWAYVSRNFSKNLQRITMVATIVAASGFWALLRTDGMDAEVHHDFKWRWAKTAEEKLLSSINEKQSLKQFDSVNLSEEPEWPGFRGNNRDGIVHNIKIETNWDKTPPVELWRKAIGPGCSSFAVHGDLVFTQEQLGENEQVTCYHIKTGEKVWSHSDSTRFWDAHAGAGPRSTPTLFNGRVYTLGATGILNVLDEKNGSLIWSRNAAKDTRVTIPGWGYTGSPLVVDSNVFVSISGQILAYGIANGKILWSSKDGGESYCSPQLFTIDGVKQILFTNKEGLTSYNLSDGKILWEHKWPGVRVIQPCQTNETDLLVGAESRVGLRLISLKNNNNSWSIEEKWTTNKLRPDYNDIVIHKGYIYGFEGPSIACIDIKTGNRLWKGGRYGGQLLLLAEQDALIILTEKGDIALVRAIPEKFEELTKIQSIKGKTWNHPAIAKDILLVRNTQEMVAYRLPLKEK